MQSCATGLRAAKLIQRHEAVPMLLNRMSDLRREGQTASMACVQAVHNWQAQWEMVESAKIEAGLSYQRTHMPVLKHGNYDILDTIARQTVFDIPKYLAGATALKRKKSARAKMPPGFAKIPGM